MNNINQFENGLRDDIKELRQDVRELRKEMNKYKGFVGGVMWAVGTLGAGLGFFLSLLNQK